jgi:hypothetical protein
MVFWIASLAMTRLVFCAFSAVKTVFLIPDSSHPNLPPQAGEGVLASFSRE